MREMPSCDRLLEELKTLYRDYLNVHNGDKNSATKKHELTTEQQAAARRAAAEKALLARLKKDEEQQAAAVAAAAAAAPPHDTNNNTGSTAADGGLSDSNDSHASDIIPSQLNVEDVVLMFDDLGVSDCDLASTSDSDNELGDFLARQQQQQHTGSAVVQQSYRRRRRREHYRRQRMSHIMNITNNANNNRKKKTNGDELTAADAAAGGDNVVANPNAEAAAIDEPINNKLGAATINSTNDDHAVNNNSSLGDAVDAGGNASTIPPASAAAAVGGRRRSDEQSSGSTHHNNNRQPAHASHALDADAAAAADGAGQNDDNGDDEDDDDYYLDADEASLQDEYDWEKTRARLLARRARQAERRRNNNKRKASKLPATANNSNAASELEEATTTNTKQRDEEEFIDSDTLSYNIRKLQYAVDTCYSEAESGNFANNNKIDDNMYRKLSNKTTSTGKPVIGLLGSVNELTMPATTNMRLDVKAQHEWSDGVEEDEIELNLSDSDWSEISHENLLNDLVDDLVEECFSDVWDSYCKRHFVPKQVRHYCVYDWALHELVKVFQWHTVPHDWGTGAPTVDDFMRWSIEERDFYMHEPSVHVDQEPVPPPTDSWAPGCDDTLVRAPPDGVMQAYFSRQQACGGQQTTTLPRAEAGGASDNGSSLSAKKSLAGLASKKSAANGRKRSKSRIQQM